MIKPHIALVLLMLLSLNVIAGGDSAYIAPRDQDQGHIERELDEKIQAADKRIKVLTTQINTILKKIDAHKKSIANSIANKDRIIDCGVLDLFNSDIKTLTDDISNLKKEVANQKSKKEIDKQKLAEDEANLSDSIELLRIHNITKKSYRNSLKKGANCDN